MELKERFDDAAKRVRTLKTAGPDQLLKLYGLFKQGSEGDVQGKRPGILDLKGRAKYDAWASRKGLTSDQAREDYIKYVDELLRR